MTLYRCTITGFYHTQTVQNVIHFRDRVGQGVPPPQPQVIAEDIAANWVPAQRNLHHISFRFNSVECVEIRNPAPMPAAIVPLALLGNGGVSQSHSVSTFKIRWITARGGKRGRGKMNIGGIEWSLLESEAVLSQTARDRLLAFCAAIEGRYMNVDISSPVPFNMVLVHKDPNDPPNDIITCDFMPNLGTMRSRNKNVGI